MLVLPAVKITSIFSPAVDEIFSLAIDAIYSPVVSEKLFAEDLVCLLIERIKSRRRDIDARDKSVKSPLQDWPLTLEAMA